MTRTVDAPTLRQIEEARARIEGAAIRTPLVRLEVDAPVELHLKLECLQPIGSFKIRGASNAMAAASQATLARGVATASAGNMAQGVAWSARRLGVPCTVVIPDHAPEAKRAAIERLGGRLLPVPFDRWWQAMVDHAFNGINGLFIHPVSDTLVIAGNGTVGLEIVEDLPDVDAVLVPFGGGGLSCGIAIALRGRRSAAPVIACEVETAAPLARALRDGAPSQGNYTPSFVDGIGSTGVLEEMWPHARDLLGGAVTVSLGEIAAAIRLLVARARVVAEGAGAAGVAAALGGRAGLRRGAKVVAVVSGGNIDPAKLATILRGEVP
jgi:threonine dehydratase